MACTAEAKLCPDGSYVGRAGSNCEFAACPSATPATSTAAGSAIPRESGVRGAVMLGPTCPVERIPPDPNCADKPYQTPVIIFRASDPTSAFFSVNSDTSGKFSALLPPGEYILKAGGNNYYPRCGQTQVAVEPYAFASTTIYCDTGIR